MKGYAMTETLIISIMGTKGGQTKTTTATTLACGLALAYPDDPVVLIEADAQGNASEALRVEPFDGLQQVLIDNAEFDDVLVNIDEAVIGGQANLLLLPSSTGQSVAVDMNTKTPALMRERFNELRGFARFVICDFAPGTTNTTVGGYYASDYIILPTLVEMDGVNSIKKMMEFLAEAEIEGKEIGWTPGKVLGILPNRYAGRTDDSASYNVGRLEGAFLGEYLVFPKVDDKPVWRRARDYHWSIYAHAKHHDSDYERRAARMASRQFNHVVQRVLALQPRVMVGG